MSHDPHPNQFALLKQRRFAPFFWTQFLGAANDNVFKFAFTLMITYQLQLDWLPPSHAGLVIGALFILPYVLFSATSGQLADKHDKARLMQLVKSLEIAIMAVAGWGLLCRQRAVAARLRVPDGPALHAVWPGQVRLPAAAAQRARADRAATAWWRWARSSPSCWASWPAACWWTRPRSARSTWRGPAWRWRVLGRVTAQAIPPSPSTDPNLVINWNPFTETWRNLKLAPRRPGGVPLAAGHLSLGCGSSAPCS